MTGNKLFLCVCFALAVSAAQAGVTVTNVVIQQRWPWNGLVDIDYEVLCDTPGADIYVYPTALERDTNLSIALRTLTGEGAAGPVKAGRRRMTWNMTADQPALHSSALSVKIAASGAAPYLVIDLSGGTNAVSYPITYTNLPPNLADHLCRTTNLWLRLILPGTFLMGSPTDELGREVDETLHSVTLTQPYYIGVFEVTQKQWQLIMGTVPSQILGDTLPADRVSYDMIRGTVSGAAWPVNGQADADSFFGKLRARTAVLLDLPTEAQWEYACRAGTGTALNSGKHLTATNRDPNMDEVGRYAGNTRDGKGGNSVFYTKVGSYIPNAWGLYDMHGNVLEWCLDWYGAYPGGVMDPKGGAAGTDRIFRGGGFPARAAVCRSAVRPKSIPSASDTSVGLRVVALPAAQ